MRNTTDLFVDYLYELSSRPIPEKIKEKSKECLIDYVGVAFAGAQINHGYFDDILKKVSGNCTLIGYDTVKSDAVMSAFINGFNAHTMELDDGHRFGMIHLGSVVISAVMAVAQQENISFDNIMTGIIMGYEAAVRTALSIQPGHKKLGFHTTGTCGTIGAAIGCACALGYSKSQIKTTLSAAATSASGLLEIQEDSSELKSYNVAQAAMNGVAASYIGKSGLCGPDDILGGDRGMLSIHSNTVSEEKLTQKTDYYEIERIYVKPYAACRHCHSAMEAAIFLRNEYNIKSENIKKIIVETYKLAIRGHDHTDIQGIASSKLSMPYCVAASYILKTGSIDAFSTDNLNNQDIIGLINKTEIKENEQFTAVSSSKRIARVKIVNNDGDVFEHQVDYAKGDPENAMTREEIFNKFMSIMNWCNQQSKGKIISQLFYNNAISSQDLFSKL